MTVSHGAVVVQGDDSLQLRELARLLRESADTPPQLVLDRGIAVPLPRAVTEALELVVAHLAAGDDVTIAPFDGCTPEAAAYYLGASRSYVARVLADGELPYRLIDAEVRIAHADLAQLRAKLTELMREGIRLIQQLSEEEGAYDSP